MALETRNKTLHDYNMFGPQQNTDDQCCQLTANRRRLRKCMRVRQRVTWLGSHSIQWANGIPSQTMSDFASTWAARASPVVWVVKALFAVEVCSLAVLTHLLHLHGFVAAVNSWRLLEMRSFWHAKTAHHFKRQNWVIRGGLQSTDDSSGALFNAQQKKNVSRAQKNRIVV